jgi:general secretion pathway protein I
MTMTQPHDNPAGTSLETCGFTLLEVMLALAILATALTILMGTMATSNQQAVYANKLTRITQAARSKMVDLEFHLRQEGFTENVRSRQGEFEEIEFDEVSWEAEIQPVEIPEEIEKQLMGRVNAQLFGGTDSEGALKGNAAFSSKLPQLIGCVPQMINRLGKQIRRIILKVEYTFNGREQTLTLSEYVIDRSTNQYNLFGAEQPSAGSSSSSSGAGSSGF